MWSAVSVFGTKFWQSIMSEPPPPEEELEKENKFAGESFGTDNVRTVYAGSSHDTKERESRIIILVGPSGTGKSTLIDCMCNYFYGAKLGDSLRYKIADERFDNTTPKKSIIKYVFNGTEMPYRPIVIDTPGIGDPSGLKADDELKGMISAWLAFDPRAHIHVVGLVIRASLARLTPRTEAELQHTLSLFPRWMHANVVPMVTGCDGSPEPSAVILRHFDLHNNRRFRFNTSALYQKPSANHLSEQLRQMYWDLSMSNMEEFFDHVGRVHPQCVEEQLNPRHMERAHAGPTTPPPSAKPPSPPYPPPPPPLKTPQSPKPVDVPSTIAEEAPSKPPREEPIPSYDLPPIGKPSEEEEVVSSIKRYTYDPWTLSHNLHLVAEKRTLRSEPASKRSSVVVRNQQRSSFHENGDVDFERVHQKLVEARPKETNLDDGLGGVSSAESSPTEEFRKNGAEFSLRSTASEWHYTPSAEGTARRFRPGSGIRRSGDTENLTPLRREPPAEEPPLQPLTTVFDATPQPAPRDSIRRNGAAQYENVPGNTVPPPVPLHGAPLVVAPLVRDTDIDADLEDDGAGFRRNDISRTSFHSSSLKNGRLPSNRPDSSNYGDDWGSDAPPPDHTQLPSEPTEWEAIGYKPNLRLEPPKSLVVASRPYFCGDRREPLQEKRLLRDVEANPVASKYQYSEVPPLISPKEPKAPANTPSTPLRRRGAPILEPKYLCQPLLQGSKPEERRVEKPRREILNCCFFLLAPIIVIFIFAAIMLTLILAH
ncbi:hypothetical protein QR680_017060 [Steinernema hermaphroditum]|uniref:Rad50/SbcC-type AAA domain-containing protein n=1 Tax=Steinernema hermaphroditum TaxID=289476 RepID=A0AA39LNK1_9BILA|nr:hypothetical protein QR680_017060 [Steinernema hermaphroditum]